MRKLEMLSETQRAYIAGILDGEGCLGMRRQPTTPQSFVLVIFVVSTDRELIDWLYKVTDIGNVYDHKTLGGRKSAWKWYVGSHRDIVDLLKLVYPFLIIKKRRAEILIEVGEVQKNRKAHRISEKEKEWREAMFNEFKSLLSHQPLSKGGEFGETPTRDEEVKKLAELPTEELIKKLSSLRTTPSQASHSEMFGEEGVETTLEITAISSAPERDDIVQAT